MIPDLETFRKPLKLKPHLQVFKNLWSSLRDRRRSFVGVPDGDQLAKVQLVVVDLSDEDGRHSLVQRRAVHVDGGPHGEDEASDLPLDVTVLQQTLHGDGQRGRAEDRQTQRF